MPAAGVFNAKGKFYGLPYCPERVDVSDMDAWCTLGGTEKGNAPTPAEIALSIQNAVKLHFFAYSITGSASAYSNYDGEGNVEDSEYNGTALNGTVEDGYERIHTQFYSWAYEEGKEWTERIYTGDAVRPFLPRKRVCGPGVYFEPSSANYGLRFGGSNIMTYSHESNYWDASVSVLYWRHPRIIAMYDGATFVGYGVETLFTDSTAYPVDYEERYGSWYTQPTIWSATPQASVSGNSFTTVDVLPDGYHTPPDTSIRGDLAPYDWNPVLPGPFNAYASVYSVAYWMGLHIHSFGSYVPDLDYFPLNEPEGQFTNTRSVAPGTLGGVHFLEINYKGGLGTNNPTSDNEYETLYANAALTGLDFYT